MLSWHITSIKINVSSEVKRKEKNAYLGPKNKYAVVWALFMLFCGDIMLVVACSVSANNTVVRKVRKNEYLRLMTCTCLKPCPLPWRLGATAAAAAVVVVVMFFCEKKKVSK